MYPKKFIFDPVQISRARQVTLSSPSLNVLRPETRDQMPFLAHFLEDGFKARDAQHKLLLPDLSALKNTTIGIFSDYSGESTGKYLTYSFLICAYGSLGTFKERMAEFRTEAALGDKEIAFKDFGMGQLQRALPGYLRLLDNYVPGLVFTLAVDKTIPCLFGPGTEPHRAMVALLEEAGYGDVSSKTTEKLFRVAHVAAFLLALLGHEGQKIFWMTDHDAIGATSEKHKVLLETLCRVLPLYTTKSFGILGGARPFEPRVLEHLDLLSVADIAAGSIAQCLTRKDVDGPDCTEIKPGGNEVLRWLCHNSIVLKKFSMMIKRDTKVGIGFSPIDMEALTPVEDEVFIPMQLMR